MFIISCSTHACAKALNKEIITVSATLQLLSLNKAAEHQCCGSSLTEAQALLSSTMVTHKLQLCTVMVRSMHCSMKLLIVTIVEIHMLILDVCVCLNDAVVLKVWCIRCFVKLSVASFSSHSGSYSYCKQYQINKEKTKKSHHVIKD